MINGGEFEALIHSRSWRVQAPQLYSICVIMVCDIETNVFLPFWSFEANFQVEVMMGNVENLGAIAEVV